MIYLLGEPEDNDLLWLAVMLQRRGMQVEFVLPEDLLLGSALTCRIDNSGAASSLRLHDGREINADMAGLVINRLADLPSIGGAISPADKIYLAEEWRAALVAWLRTLQCPVLNPPRAGSLTGPVLLPAAWRSIANAHDLMSRPWNSTETLIPADPVNLLCLGGRCIDPTNSAPASIGRSLAKMAKYVGAPLLGATFEREGDSWFFIEATSLPQLTEAGEQLVDAIYDSARAGRLPV